jgi:transposase
MHTFEQLTHFAGFDWAKDHHDAVILDRQGATVQSVSFAHTAEGWAQWRETIKAYPALGVAIETNQGAAVEQLLQSQVTVYPMQPKAAERYRDRHVPSGSKTDRTDAWCFGDALRVDGQHWRPLAPEDPLTEELRLLCRDEVELITQRTALVNQLQQALYEYYPAALEAFEDWTAPYAWEFVLAYPTADQLVKAGQRKWEKFLHTHKLWRPETAPKRLEIFGRADRFCGSEAVTRAKSRLAVSTAQVLRTLQKQLEEYRRVIEKLFAQHPDHDLFGSLPGAGAKLAPRLLSEIGSDREQYPDAQGLRCLAGTAPVSFESGKIRRAKIRWHCNRQLRHAVHLWSDCSRKFCAWAGTYYQAQRDKGKSHACALRCLGQRWLNILWKMWQSRQPYDETLHALNQQRHGSWLFAAEAPNDLTMQ